MWLGSWNEDEIIGLWEEEMNKLGDSLRDEMKEYEKVRQLRSDSSRELTKSPSPPS